ncbi:CDP-glucose 4,6-dehydratase [Bosea sp. LjRoot237]|uniref:CDP-glucose 4,6-dehydratase n=1 Tax=Bosea sp. LjRoot237 TaxID=3342292 RepID=UPI003ECD4E2B
MVIDRGFWRGRRVLITGHTGFKGAWMSLVLARLGAEVHGFALPPDDSRGIFEAGRVRELVHHQIGDICNRDGTQAAIAQTQPDIVIHMAAQALVRLSYAQPVETYAANVMGTVHVLEAVRHVASVQAVVVVTSDKCYANNDDMRSFSETDRFGGHDPYSNSKGCAELVTDAYRCSFFRGASSARIATARAGNVVGGGDWSQDRLVPDAMRAFSDDRLLRIRNPAAIRPWQHVLDPVLAYLLLAERLVKDGEPFAEGWNFGPTEANEVPVRYVVDKLVSLWGGSARWEHDGAVSVAEAAFLKLDCRKAAQQLGWHPLLPLDEALRLTVAWHEASNNGKNMREISIEQIEGVLEKLSGYGAA